MAEPERFRFWPSKATIHPDGLVTFTGPISTTQFYIADVQRIVRHLPKGEELEAWEIVFAGGSRSVQGNAGKKLALRLCQLNPDITTNFDLVKTADEGLPVWWTPTDIYPASFRAEAVRRVQQEGGTVPNVAAQMGCPVESLRQWIQVSEMDQVHRRQNEASQQASGPAGRLVGRVVGWFAEKWGAG